MTLPDYEPDEIDGISVRYTADEMRDDTGLVSLACPHCKAMVPAPIVQAFEHRQLVFLRCENCGNGISKQQIGEAYREYVK